MNRRCVRDARNMNSLGGRPGLPECTGGKTNNHAKPTHDRERPVHSHSSNDLSVSRAPPENRDQSAYNPPENGCEVTPGSATAHCRGRSHRALPAPHHCCPAPWDHASDSSSNTWSRTNPAPTPPHSHAYRRDPKH